MYFVLQVHQSIADCVGDGYETAAPQTTVIRTVRYRDEKPYDQPQSHRWDGEEEMQQMIGRCPGGVQYLRPAYLAIACNEGITGHTERAKRLRHRSCEEAEEFTRYGFLYGHGISRYRRFPCNITPCRRYCHIDSLPPVDLSYHDAPDPIFYW